MSCRILDHYRGNGSPTVARMLSGATLMQSSKSGQKKNCDLSSFPQGVELREQDNSSQNATIAGTLSGLSVSKSSFRINVRSPRTWSVGGL